MSKPKLTGWYPGEVKPVHVGMYQSKSYCGEPQWRYWGGNRWGWGYENKRWAHAWRNQDGATQDNEWRGLTEPSK